MVKRRGPLTAGAPSLTALNPAQPNETEIPTLLHMSPKSAAWEPPVSPGGHPLSAGSQQRAPSPPHSPHVRPGDDTHARRANATAHLAHRAAHFVIHWAAGRHPHRALTQERPRICRRFGYAGHAAVRCRGTPLPSRTPSDVGGSVSGNGRLAAWKMALSRTKESCRRRTRRRRPRRRLQGFPTLTMKRSRMGACCPCQGRARLGPTWRGVRRRNRKEKENPRNQTALREPGGARVVSQMGSRMTVDPCTCYYRSRICARANCWAASWQRRY